MKHKTNFTLLLVLALSLTGCLGIEEKIMIRKNGSGSFTYTIDCTKMMKQMLDMVNSLSKAFAGDSTSSKPKKVESPEDLKQETLRKMRDEFVFNRDGQLQNVKGISRVREFADTTGGKFLIGVNFQFDNVDALNNVLKTMLGNKEKNGKFGGMPAPVYAFKNGVLSRELPKNTVDGLVSDKEDELVKKMMKDFRYVLVVESEGKIGSTTAPGAAITKEGKTARFEYQIMERKREIVQSKMRSEAKVY